MLALLDRDRPPKGWYAIAGETFKWLKVFETLLTTRYNRAVAVLIPLTVLSTLRFLNLSVINWLLVAGC